MEIYLNFYALCSALTTILCAAAALFLTSLRSNSKPTRILAIAFWAEMLFLGPYVAGYSIYGPLGAYHRLFTVFFILFGVGMFIFYTYRFEGDHLAAEYKIVKIVLLAVMLLNFGYFVYEISQREIYYDFSAKYFNFQAGKVISIFILLFLVVLVQAAYRKSRRLQGRQRKAIFQYTAIFIFIMLGPGITNYLSLVGKVTRDTHIIIFSTTVLLGFFFILLNYINYTVDRSTFMVKIVGISLVVLLILLQTVSYFINRIQNDLYDRLSVEKSLRAIETSDFSKGVRYVAVLTANNPHMLHKAEDIALEAPDLLQGKTTCSVDFKGKDSLTPETVADQTRKFSGADAVLDNNRIYRCDRGNSHYYIAYNFTHNDVHYEVGLDYENYRLFIHKTFLILFVITIVLVMLVLVVFPLFFRASLVDPLDRLLEGVGEVNKGNLDVRIPIDVHDEIGFLSESFNSMVLSIKDAKTKLQEYADNLEEKVEERTREVTDKMEEIHALKVQQDGDYFLTSLIARPLASNRNKSNHVGITMYIEQKKKFTFRQKTAELGGDICISGNLRFGDDDGRWVLFANGDAMGKSMQGAGGAIVLGTSLNNIMSRSAADDRVIAGVTPKEWLINTYHELDNVFKTFDGSMMSSVVMGIINEKTGQMFYFNCEHPWTVLYRDGMATFIEHELTQRKLGSLSEFLFTVQEHQLFPGDVIIAGSDGRDDILLGYTASGERIINEDEDLFLEFVKEGGSDLDRVVEQIHNKGGITDDLSLLRIGFREADIETGDVSASHRLYLEGKHHFENGSIDEAVRCLERSYDEDRRNFDALHLLAQLVYRQKDFVRAIELLKAYIEEFPRASNFWFYLSIAHKQMKQFAEARRAAQQVRTFQPLRTANLINLSDCYRMLGEFDRALEAVEKALQLEPGKPTALKLRELIVNQGGLED